MFDELKYCLVTITFQEVKSDMVSKYPFLKQSTNG